MRVFLSWSGDLSRELALILKDWLDDVMPSVHPWISEEIEPGTRWSKKISESLAESSIGIIIITRENMRSPWLLFEAGAISKELDDTSRVCPLLWNVSSRNLDGPLSQFQAVSFNQEGILRLMRSLNQASPSPIPDKILSFWIDRNYNNFEAKIASLSPSANIFGSEISAYVNDNQFENVHDPAFFQSIDYDKVNEIDIIGHTGKNLIFNFLHCFCSNLSGEKKRKRREIRVRILLRNPWSELSSRAQDISGSFKDIKRKQKDEGFENINVQFYQSLPAFRAAILRTKNEDFYLKSGFISFYYFPKNLPSKKFDSSIFFQESKREEYKLATVVDSWFEHYWGKSHDKEIHTIIFDFDGTIVDSYEAQVDSWVELVIKAKDRDDMFGSLNTEIRELVDDKVSLKKRFVELFFEHQNANDIMEKVFSGLDKKLRKVLVEWRSKIRKEKTIKESDLFSNAKEVIKGLAKMYHLIIISATDEDTVTDYLAKKDLSTSFLYKFGRVEGVFEEKKGFYGLKGVERKTQLIQKVTSIVGVPLDRL